MAEAGDLLLALQLAAHEAVDALGRGVLADLEQHLHHLGVGAAVQRPLQRADAGDDRRVDVGEGGGGDARGEGRGVQLVVGVQHQRDVHRPHRGRVGTLAGEHVEEVGGVAERRVGGDRAAAGLQPAPGRHQARHLAGEPHRLAVRRPRRVVVGIGIVVRQRRGQRAQRVHAVHRRQHLHQPQHRLGQRPRRRQLRLQIAELGLHRQAAVPQQVAVSSKVEKRARSWMS